jgi:regulatory protein
VASKGREQARAYAFLLLKYRQRSRKELETRLKLRKFPADVIEEVVDSLAGKGFVDDTAFAKAWIASRAGQRFGQRRIRQELRVKGVAPEVIDQGLRALQEFSPEAETVRVLAEEKFRKLKDLDSQTAKRRIYAYLLRRGFPPETVIDILNGLR